MMTASEWNRQHKAYEEDGYGYDINVQPKHRSKEHTGVVLLARDKLFILRAILLIGIMCIGVVITSAFVASVTYQNNQLKAQNAALQSEVDTLQTQVDSATNLSTVASKASDKLGMVFPDGRSYVEITSADKTQDGFAASLKKQAFD
ncbi:MAG: cell division protein FtsL [Anaerovoracaceae bacterium]|nr:cell division protein FtsL [Anaerovoracaceae bacterium]